MIYLYCNNIVSDMVKLRTGSENLHHEVLFIFRVWKNCNNFWKNKNKEQKHLYTLPVCTRFAHIFHLLSRHLSKAGTIISLILWIRKQDHWSLNGLPNKHTPLVSDWTMNSKFHAPSTVNHAASPKQFKAEEAKSKEKLEVLRFFPSLKNKRLYKENEWSL